MYKKLSLFIFVTIFSLPFFALAQDVSTSTVNCFDYYKFGSVQVTAESETSNVVTGNKINFVGTIKNSNSYPIVDGTVVVKIFRMQAEQNANGPYVVDQFVAKDDVYIGASSTQKFDFSWNVPTYAKSGDYQIATFFTSGKEFNLLGLTFTDDIVGNQFNFKVSGKQEKIVEFDKNSVKINNTPYFFAAFPPTVDTNKDAVVTANLLNETDQSQQVKITWKTYWWDAQKEENLLDTKTEDVNLNEGEKKNISYTITDTTHSVYLVVAEVDYKDTKSILGARFTRNGINIPRINFPAVTSFPLTKGTGTTLFSCLHNTNNGDIENGSLSLKLEDSSGKVFHDFTYNGKITGEMMGVKDDFVPSQSYDKFSLVAELSQNGKVIDTAKMDYDCKSIDPSKCLSTSKINLSVAVFLVILLIIAFVLLFIFEKRRHKTIVAISIIIISIITISYLGSAYKAFGQTPSYNSGGGASVVWNYSNPGSLYTFSPMGAFLPVLSPTSVSVHYNVTSSKLSGSQVSPGDTIRFTFDTQSSQDISWFGSGGTFDSPYGIWKKNGASTLLSSSQFAPADFYNIGNITTTVGSAYYVSLTVNPPNKSLINTDGLSCGEMVSTGGSGSYVDCTVLPVSSSTIINPSFHFDPTYGYFYIAIGDPSKRGFLGLFGSESGGTSSGGLNLRTLLDSNQNPFKLNVPTQNIPYNFTVVTSSCSNGATNPPDCTTSPTCLNGATNYPTCTTNDGNSCVNGATNPPTCTINSSGACINGDIDPPACVTAPAVPQTPTLTAATSPTCGGGVNLSWNTVSGASGYYIYKSSTSNGTYSKLFTGGILDPVSSIEDQSGPGTYYYKITAYNSTGEESSASSPIQGTASGVCLSASVKLTPSKSSISFNSSCTLDWSIANATSTCTIIGANINGAGNNSYTFSGSLTTGSKTTGNLSSSASYTLSCMGLDGKSVSTSAMCSITPKMIEN